MRLLLVTVLLLATTAGCLSADTPDPGPRGQIDGAALNHILIPFNDVVVRLPELGMTTRTTALGGFSFFDVPIGFHVVELQVPGVGTDREIIAVSTDEISRVILQIFPHPSADPHVTLRSDAEIVDIAMPGEICEECAWRTAVSEGRPVAVELLVEWDARHPVFADWRTDLIVALLDESGNLIAGPLTKADVVNVGGLNVLHVLAPASSMSPDISSLKVTFMFDAGNEAPHPDFQVESRLCLHYVEEERVTACSI